MVADENDSSGSTDTARLPLGRFLTLVVAVVAVVVVEILVSVWKSTGTIEIALMTGAKTPDYFHLRDASGAPLTLSLEDLRSRTAIALRRAFDDHLLSERCGYPCVDGVGYDWVQRKLCEELMFEAFLKIEPPVADNLYALDERQVMGLHEAIHDLVSYPVEGFNHDYNDCGYHPVEYDTAKGRAVWIEQCNRYLTRYPPGYVMGPGGRVTLMLDEPEAAILDSKLPPHTEPDVVERVERAVARFRRGTSSWDDRESAVRDLGDVLERIRPKVRKHLLKKDERDLFDLLNNFQIRHFNVVQKADYDRPIFLTLAFYEFLATIHACERLAARGSS